MTFEFSDGGKVNAGIAEKNDCTVRAFSIISGIDYTTTHSICAEYGRKDGKGFSNFLKSVQSIGKKLGVNLKSVKRSGTLNKLIETYPIGSLLVLVRGHAFAVVDGIVKDTGEQSGNRHVHGAWLVLTQQGVENE